MLKVSPQACLWRARSMNWSRSRPKLTPVVGQVLVDQPEREFVVAGRYGCMGGKNIAAFGLFDRFFERHALQRPVHALVPGSGRRRDLRSCARRWARIPAPARRAPRPRPAAPPGRCAGRCRAPVQAGGQFAVLGGVLVQVGIQQVERDAPDAQFPDAGIDRPVGKIDGDLEQFTFPIENGPDGQVVEIERIVDRFLPAVLGDALGEEIPRRTSDRCPPGAGQGRKLPSGGRLPALPTRRSRSAGSRASQIPSRNRPGYFCWRFLYVREHQVSLAFR